MVKIFVSYRRDDSRHVSERIYDRLAVRFGNENVFKDVDSIPLGEDFRPILDKAVGQCAVLLAVVGPRWLAVTDANGRRRLDDLDDFVRLELERALARGIPVIPVLVDGATLPKAKDLPASLQSLFYRQATQVRPDPDFRHDVDRLIDACAKIKDSETVAGPTSLGWWLQSPVRMAAAALAVIALIVVIVLLALPRPDSPASLPKPGAESPLPSKPAELAEQASQIRGPIEITSLEINHHRGEQAEQLGKIRKIATLSDDIFFDDDVRVHIELSAQAYCYLIAFNPDGKDQMCYPRKEDVPPKPVDKLDYPAEIAKYFPLNDGVGLQAFVLVATRSPLPAYEEWRKAHGSPPWKKTRSADIWRFDGQKLEQVELQRGQPRERGGAPVALQQLCDFFKSQPSVEAVQVVAFPVLAKEADKTTPNKK
jgi:hypothetical protein